MEKKEFISKLKAEIATYVAERKFQKVVCKTVYRDENLVTHRKSELDRHSTRELTINLTPRLMYVVYGLLRGRSRTVVETTPQYSSDSPQYACWKSYMYWQDMYLKDYMRKYGFEELFVPCMTKEVVHEQVPASAS